MGRSEVLHITISHCVTQNYTESGQWHCTGMVILLKSRLHRDILDVQTFQFSNYCSLECLYMATIMQKRPLSSTLVYIVITHLTDTVSAH